MNGGGMITIENNRTNPLTGLGILKDLESFNINDIDELSNYMQNRKPYFGNGWEEKVAGFVLTEKVC